QRLRSKQRTVVVLLQDSHRPYMQLRSELSDVIVRDALPIERRRSGRERLRHRGLLAGDCRLRNGPFLNGPYWLACQAVEDVEETLFTCLSYRLHGLAVYPHRPGSEQRANRNPIDHGGPFESARHA